MIASKEIRSEVGNVSGEVLLDPHRKVIRIVINNVACEYPAAIVDDQDLTNTVQVLKELAAHL